MLVWWFPENILLYVLTAVFMDSSIPINVRLEASADKPIQADYIGEDDGQSLV